MSDPEKYANPVLRQPSAHAIETLAWFFVPAVAVLPALVAGALAGLAVEWADRLRTLALVWGIGAAFAALVLEAWRSITKRFTSLPFSTALTIGAIAGGVVAMVAGLTAETAAGFGLRAFCGLAGALQGSAVAWLIARPDMAPPEVEEHTPNPPTDLP